MSKRRKKPQTITPKASKRAADDSRLPMPGAEEIEEALRAHCGIIVRAANALGVSREWLSRRVNASKELDALRHEAGRFAFDVSVDGALKLMDSGDKDATLQVLRLTGHRYGFKTGAGVEVSGPAGGPLQVEHAVDPAFIDELVREIFGGPTGGDS